MPKGEKKQVAFKLWKDGKSLRVLQTTVPALPRTLPSSRKPSDGRNDRPEVVNHHRGRHGT
jgi:hypothetical protein